MENAILDACNEIGSVATAEALRKQKKKSGNMTHRCLIKPLPPLSSALTALIF